MICTKCDFPMELWTRDKKKIYVCPKCSAVAPQNKEIGGKRSATFRFHALTINKVKQLKEHHNIATDTSIIEWAISSLHARTADKKPDA